MRTNTQDTWRKLVYESILGIFAKLDGRVSNHDLASDACFSTYHFHRMFCGLTGETASEMARRLRLERAAYHLNWSQTPVTEIAFDAGFETLEAFSRAFKCSFGSSPSLFRRLKNHNGQASAPNSIHWSPVGPPEQFAPIEYIGDDMELSTKQLPRIRLACIRHIGPYNTVGSTWAKIYQIHGQHPFAKPGGLNISIFRDNPDNVPADLLRSDVCVQVDEGTVLPEGLVEDFIPEGRYAMTTHRGAYSGLGEAWGAFCGKMIPEAGLTFRDGVCFEAYLNDCGSVPESDLLTELYEPIV